MPAPWIVKSVDVLEQRQFALPPDQLGLQRFEEGFNNGVVIAISLAAHRDFEAMLFQQLLVIM